MKNVLTIIGGGLAGTEAAYQASKRGVKVRLFEMRPQKMTEAHKTENLSELVCSNSLKSDDIATAHGLLKAEMRELDSLIIKCADESRVPAGTALSVDREKFSSLIEEELLKSGVEIIREEVTDIPDEGVVIIASGPLTSEALSDKIQKLLGSDSLYFYDAISPIVYKDSIDFDKAFFGSRYGKGGDDYINCPMTKNEYEEFYNALISANQTVLKEFDQIPEKTPYFEGCMPIEELARRGERTLTFGPMKPVGFTVKTPDGEEKRPYAIVQLRAENIEGTIYNIVGFQTRLKQGEQKRVFRMIPGMENAEFARLGSIHRNSYIDSPRLLNADMSLRENKRIFMAGQITGVEGYTESALSGLVAGLNGFNVIADNDIMVLPLDTMSGALLRYITDDSFQSDVIGRPKKFQPMNANYGLIAAGSKKKDRTIYRDRALESIKTWKDKYLATAGGI